MLREGHRVSAETVRGPRRHGLHSRLSTEKDNSHGEELVRQSHAHKRNAHSMSVSKRENGFQGETSWVTGGFGFCFWAEFHLSKESTTNRGGGPAKYYRASRPTLYPRTPPEFPWYMG